MFESGQWFAWFPVTAKCGSMMRTVWLQTVYRDRTVINGNASKWRYYI